jgi:hypothetical protein
MTTGVPSAPHEPPGPPFRARLFVYAVVVPAALLGLGSGAATTKGDDDTTAR